MRMDGIFFWNFWIVVFIDGNWCFVNCIWVVWCVIGYKDDLFEIFYKYDEFYFLMDFEDYIYQYYLDDL